MPFAGIIIFAIDMLQSRLDRQRGFARQTIAAEIRTVLQNFVNPPVLAFIVDYAARTDADFETEIQPPVEVGDRRSTGPEIEKVVEVFVIPPIAQLIVHYAADRFVASVLVDAGVVDLYVGIDADSSYTVRHRPTDRRIDKPINEFCRFHSVDPRGIRYYTRTWFTHEDYKSAEMYYADHNGDDGWPIIVGRYFNEVGILSSEDGKTLLIRNLYQVRQINLTNGTNRPFSFNNKDVIVQILFYRSPSVDKERFLMILYRSSIEFIDMITLVHQLIDLKNENDATSAVCLQNGIVLLSTAASTGLWLFDPADVDRPLGDMQIRTAVDGDFTLMAIDDSTRCLFIVRNQAVYRIDIPSYLWIVDNAAVSGLNESKSVFGLLRRRARRYAKPAVWQPID